MGLIGEKFERFLVFDGSLQGIFPYFSERRFSCLSPITILHFFLFFLSHSFFFPHTPPQKRQSVPQKGTCAPRRDKNAGADPRLRSQADFSKVAFHLAAEDVHENAAAAFCLKFHFAHFSLINVGGRGKSASRLCARKSVGLAGFSSESDCSLCLRYCGLVERSDESEAAGKLRGGAG